MTVLNSHWTTDNGPLTALLGLFLVLFCKSAFAVDDADLVILGGLCSVINLATGPIGRSILSFGILGAGLGAMFGKLSPTLALTIAGAGGVTLSAPQLAEWFGSSSGAAATTFSCDGTTP